MNESPFTVRRLDNVGAAQIDPLAALLIDFVEGGASVSFLLPLAPERSTAFWQRVGSIPGYALWPQGGPCATTYFYRDVLEVPA